MPATPKTAHPFAALSIAFVALGGRLLGMTMVGLTASSHSHLLENIAPPLLALGLVFVGGSAVDGG